jgi:hypothetical protein
VEISVVDFVDAGLIQRHDDCFEPDWMTAQARRQRA